MKQQLVIIGNGMATGRLLQQLCKHPDLPYQISVISAESGGSYNRVLLSPLLGKELTSDEIITLSPEWYQQNEIVLFEKDPVVEINRKHKLIICKSGLTVTYDIVVMATGSKPIVPPAENNQLQNIMAFRSLQDVDTMQRLAANKKEAVVIGGGFLGLEAAEGLRRLGMNVSLIHRSGHILNKQLDPTASNLLQEALEQRGLHFYLNSEVSHFNGEHEVESVTLNTGETVNADLVVAGIGVTPNITLAAESGLDIQRGILVNELLNTSDRDIYAIGECCQFEGNTYGLVAPIWDQVDSLTYTLMGKPSPYSEKPTATQLKISGVELFSCGSMEESSEIETLSYHDPSLKEYRKLWLKDNRLTGAVLYGDIREGQWYFEQLSKHNDLSADRTQLLFGSPFSQQNTQA